MQSTQLGNTGISVSRITMGCWGLVGGPMWGEQEEATSLSTISAALDAGINCFDTAEGYGKGYSEEVLGKALAGRRDQAVIATKVGGDQSAAAVQAACEHSLKRLQTDYIDLYQIHWPDRNTPIEETMLALYKLREAGKIRAIGVCNFGVQDLTGLPEVGHIASNQLPYSLLWRAIEYEIQPLCVQKDISVLCYSPLLHGLLAGKYTSADEVPEGRARTRHFSKTRPLTRHTEDGCEEETFTAIANIRRIAAEIEQPMSLVAVAWVLRQAGVASVIAGARTPEQVSQIAGATALELSTETLQALAAATETVKQKIGKNPDMWLSNSRFK